MEPIGNTPALTEQVREALVGAIVDGTLRSGERLAQDVIARRLGVSRQPVSHALEVLKRQGVLVHLGRKGLTVAPLEPERLRGLYAVRASLDALAARSAAERMAAGEIAGPEADALARLVDRYRGGKSRASLATRLADDARFHQMLYRMSGNPWIEEITAPQWVHFRRCMHAVLEDRARRGAVWSEHGAICDAVLAGDAAHAAQLAEAHARDAGETTAARLRAGEHEEACKP